MSLDSKLKAWAKGAGKEKVQAAAMKNLNLAPIAQSLVSCIRAVIPPALAPGFSAYAEVERGNDGTASITLEFMNKERPSFRGGPVHDIYGLFTKGWSYKPFGLKGIWHGQEVYAKTTRIGQVFVQSGVDAWKASLGSGIDVKSESINPLYQ